ncbi:MAG: hypothetical protein KatS3mg103_0913 [Phycisphaerales bacterium]|nr:MAG: hypothetical protein KatS3mg103_0913 [Phycisphaerales bacterium]
MAASGISRMSAITGRSVGPPRTVRLGPSGPSSAGMLRTAPPSAPARRGSPDRPGSPVSSTPRTRTWAPGTLAAAAQNTLAPLASGSTSSVNPPAAVRPSPSTRITRRSAEWRTPTPSASSRPRVIRTYDAPGAPGRRSPPQARRAGTRPTSSSPDTNWLDGSDSRNTWPRSGSSAGGTTRNGGQPLAPQPLHLRTKIAQRLGQGADRPLAHPRVARDHHRHRRQHAGGREEPHRRPGVLQLQGHLALAGRPPSAAHPAHLDRRAVHRDRGAPGRSNARIITCVSTASTRAPRSSLHPAPSADQQQAAVGQALAPRRAQRHAEPTPAALGQRSDRQRVGQPGHRLARPACAHLGGILTHRRLTHPWARHAPRSASCIRRLRCKPPA